MQLAKCFLNLNFSLGQTKSCPKENGPAHSFPGEKTDWGEIPACYTGKHCSFFFNSKFKFSRKFLNKSVAVRRFPRCIVSIWLILLYKNFIKIKQESLNLLSKYEVIYLPIHNRGKTLPINIQAWLLKLSQYSNMFYTETNLLYIFILTK